ncbi:MAG: MFS transporter, partial [candidate division NC10 bacterium]|nr:MFS transporter [candidate division NC10 bacterium]
MAVPPPPAPPPLRRGRVLLAACAIHVLHDGFLSSLYVLFPLMAAEFG